MSVLDRTLVGLGGVFLAITMTCVTGCAADSAGDEPAATADADLSSSARKALTAKVKAAYEDSVKNHRDYWLPGEEPSSSSELRGKALTDFGEAMENSRGYGYGSPEVRVAKVAGKTVYEMSGIVSDTGDFVTFYDASGKELCSAYSGQGENLNANGVDWWE